MDRLAKALARATTRRATIGALLGAFAVSRHPQPTQAVATTSGCYGQIGRCGCVFFRTCCRDYCGEEGVVPPLDNIQESIGCFNFSDDRNHCGGCDVQCGAGEACVGGDVRIQKPGVCRSIVSSAPSGAPASAGYTVTDLGTGSGNAGSALKISDDSTIVGTQQQIANGQIVESSVRLVLWRNGTTTDLTALGFIEELGFDAAGDLIGWRGNDEVRYHMRDSTIEPAPNAALSTITPPAGFVRVTYGGRNDRGEEVGVLYPHADDADGARGFVKTATGLIVLDPASGGDTSVAADLNNVSVVVGGPYVDDSGYAFRYDLVAATMTDLAPLPNYARAYAYAVNDPGDVVGFSERPSDPSQIPSRACLWPAGATVAIALDDLLPAGAGWRFREANDINDEGEIVGDGWVGSEPYPHPFVLRPIR